MEMEEICGVDNLQRSVEESWSKTWAPAIITQAQLEKDNNARLRKAMTSLNGPHTNVHTYSWVWFHTSCGVLVGTSLAHHIWCDYHTFLFTV